MKLFGKFVKPWHWNAFPLVITFIIYMVTNQEKYIYAVGVFIITTVIALLIEGGKKIN